MERLELGLERLERLELGLGLGFRLGVWIGSGFGLAESAHVVQAERGQQLAAVGRRGIEHAGDVCEKQQRARRAPRRSRPTWCPR